MPTNKISASPPPQAQKHSLGEIIRHNLSDREMRSRLSMGAAGIVGVVLLWWLLTEYIRAAGRPRSAAAKRSGPWRREKGQFRS